MFDCCIGANNNSFLFAANILQCQKILSVTFWIHVWMGSHTQVQWLKEKCDFHFWCGQYLNVNSGSFKKSTTNTVTMVFQQTFQNPHPNSVHFVQQSMDSLRKTEEQTSFKGCQLIFNEEKSKWILPHTVSFQCLMPIQMLLLLSEMNMMLHSCVNNKTSPHQCKWKRAQLIQNQDKRCLWEMRLSDETLK